MQRSGIHAVDIPSMKHIGAKVNGSAKINSRRANQRWFVIEYPVDVDYNQEAYASETKDFREHLPTDGWYSFQTDSGAEARQHWFITGAMKIVGAVSEQDVRTYAREHGFEEDLPWLEGKAYSEDDAIDLAEYMRTTGTMPTPSKTEMHERIEAERGKVQFARDDNLNVVVDEDVTPEKVLSTLKDIYTNKVGTNFTFPILKHTPQVYRDWCDYADRSFVMPAKKARDAMKYGKGHKHGLKPEGLMYVINNLYRPDYIIEEHGDEHEGHHAAVFMDENGEVIAAVDIGNWRVGTGTIDGEDGFYNTLVTAYNELLPGMEEEFDSFSDYIDSLFKSPNRVVYDKAFDGEYEAPEDVALSEPLLRSSSGTSSDAIVSDDNEKIKGQMSREDVEYTPYAGRALVSEETLDQWLDDYAASNPDYAKAYIAYMSPSDFLRMTTSDSLGRQTIEEQSRGLGVDATLAYSKGQPIQLMIDTKTGKVTGHEGRHRMVALARENIDCVPVLLFDNSNKYGKTAMESLNLTGQDFNGGTNWQTATLRDIVPLSRGYREEIVKKFGMQTSSERISEKYGVRQQARFSMADVVEETPRLVAVHNVTEEKLRGALKLGGARRAPGRTGEGTPCQQAGGGQGSAAGSQRAGKA